MSVEWESERKKLTDEERLEIKEQALDKIAKSDVMLLITEREGGNLDCIWLAPRTTKEVAQLLYDMTSILDAIARKILPGDLLDPGNVDSVSCQCPGCTAARAMYKDAMRPKRSLWRRLFKRNEET